MKSLNIILLLLLALFTLLAFRSSIVFGHGLGDIVYLGVSAISFLIMLCIFLVINHKKKEPAQYVFAVIVFLILLLLCLKATILRGPEYSWQSHGIFYK